MTEPRIRQAARALLLDDDNNVLLVHFDLPELQVTGGFWACPGGGIEAGEAAETALRRELAEEVGLTAVHVEGALWTLTRFFPMRHWDAQEETWYLVRTAHFTPAPRVDVAAEGIRGIRWFSPAEIAEGAVTFSPTDLAEQLAITLRDGVPARVREIAALP